RRHARDPFVATTRPNEAKRSGKDRAGPDETRAARILGGLESLADLARAAALFRAQTGLRELRSLQALSERQSSFADGGRAKPRGLTKKLSALPSAQHGATLEFHRARLPCASV